MTFGRPFCPKLLPVSFGAISQNRTATAHCQVFYCACVVFQNAIFLGPVNCIVTVLPESGPSWPYCFNSFLLMTSCLLTTFTNCQSVVYFILPSNMSTRQSWREQLFCEPRNIYSRLKRYKNIKKSLSRLARVMVKYWLVHFRGSQTVYTSALCQHVLLWRIHASIVIVVDC